MPFTDRFTGATRAVGGAEIRAFAELTAANELDLARHDEAFRQRHGPGLLLGSFAHGSEQGG